MSAPAKIKKLDEVVVNRIAAGEVIQRPANALKELIENSLDAKSTNIQIVAKEGGMKLLQIQDNGTGIRKDDMEIVCERFTTSKLQKFEDLKSISTFGFRGEALASISHVALLTITTKTIDEKCAYKATYIDSKLKDPLKPCAGNQGTTITIENLFYNVPTRRKALSNISDEFTKVTEVVMRYAVHNPKVGFMLKKHGEAAPQVRTPHNSTKMSNIRILYGNPIARELLEIELDDEAYKFKMHCLITNPNYAGKRMGFLLFINNRLVDSTSIKKMLEDLYSVYLPKKTHPWCYISLEINPSNIDVNVHPTKHEVKFLHEDTIIERMKIALDERLAGNSASRTFYLQSRLPKTDVTADVLKEVLPEYDKDNNTEKSKKVHARELIRTDSADQKLDKFNFTVQPKNNISARMNESLDIDPKPSTSKENKSTNENRIEMQSSNFDSDTLLERTGKEIEIVAKSTEKKMENIQINEASTSWSAIVDTSPSIVMETLDSLESNSIAFTDVPERITTSPDINDILQTLKDETDKDLQNKKEQNKSVDIIADNARKKVYQIFGSIQQGEKNSDEIDSSPNEIETTSEEITNTKKITENTNAKELIEKSTEVLTPAGSENENKCNRDFKSYSINNFRREVRLTSVLQLRKNVEDNCHEGLRKILSELIYVGPIDEKSALVQSGVNLYICNTKRLAEELFYEIMLYDFANHGAVKFSEPIALYDLALLGLETEEAGWTEEDGTKDELAKSVKELFLEKAEMMKEYFSIVIDKKGNLKSLPVLLDKYFPYEAGLPMYILRLATEVDWKKEQTCFQNICRETAKYYSEINPIHDTHDWKYITEYVLYPAIKESLLPPKHFAHDSTILQITSLPDLYKIFERC